MAELTDQELDKIEKTWRAADAARAPGPASDVPRLIAEIRRQRQGPKERAGKWGTGSDRGDVPGPRRKTLYGPDGELRGMMSTTEDALLVVKALNLLERAERVEAAARSVAKSHEAINGYWRVEDREMTALRAALGAALAEEGLTQPRINGKPFRCPCGANVFRKTGNRYKCNACGEEYEGTPAER